MPCNAARKDGQACGAPAKAHGVCGRHAHYLHVPDTALAGDLGEFRAGDAAYLRRHQTRRPPPRRPRSGTAPPGLEEVTRRLLAQRQAIIDLQAKHDPLLVSNATTIILHAALDARCSCTLCRLAAQ